MSIDFLLYANILGILFQCFGFGLGITTGLYFISLIFE